MKRFSRPVVLPVDEELVAPAQLIRLFPHVNSG